MPTRNTMKATQNRIQPGDISIYWTTSERNRQPHSLTGRSHGVGSPNEAKIKRLPYRSCSEAA